MKPRATLVSKPSEDLHDNFLGWQCRIRQIAMRQDGARPSPGMRPRLLDRHGRELAPALTMLLIPKEPAESTDFFRFQVMKTPDPRDVYERALAFLQADYFQQPATFSDRLVAVLPDASPLASELVAEARCILEFDQFSQTYRLRCKVSELAPRDAAREAAIWHNRIFNPTLPGTVHVLGFQPDWATAEADPPARGRKPHA